MAYLVEKKKHEKQTLEEFREMIRKGEKPMAAVNLTCEFCSEGKKIWEVSLVSCGYAKLLPNEFLQGALKDAEGIWSCSSCRDKLKMPALKNDFSGQWDGKKEAIRKLFKR